MRSDLDKRSETQREIDDFLSKFEDPVDELSADYSPYLNEKNTTKMTAARSFYWKEVDSPDFKKIIEKNETQETTTQETQTTAPAQQQSSPWTCPCGASNIGKFCTQCGHQRD